MKKLLLSALLVASTGAAFAQATLTSVSGLVTVSTGNTLVNGASGMSVPMGSVVSTTASGSAVVSFANGCVVSLSAGQSMAVAASECNALQASVVTPRTTVFTTPVNIGLGIAGLAVLNRATRGNGNGNGNGAVVVLPETPGPAVVATPTPPRRPISRS